MRPALLVLVFLGTLSPISFSQGLASQPTEHTSRSWLSPKYAMCEGIGANGPQARAAWRHYKESPAMVQIPTPRLSYRRLRNSQAHPTMEIAMNK